MSTEELADLCDKCYHRRETDKEEKDIDEELYTGGVFEVAGANDTMSAQDKMFPDAKNTVEQERNKMKALEYALEHYKDIPLSGFFIRNCGKKCDTARGFLDLAK